MSSGVSGTKRTPIQKVIAAQNTTSPELTAVAQYLDSNTVGLIAGVNNNNTDLTAPQNKTLNMAIADGIETAFEKTIVGTDIYNGSKLVEKILNAAPVGVVLSYDAFYSGGHMQQMQWTKLKGNKWKRTWREKGGKIHWEDNSQGIGWVADEIWNDYNGAYEG